MEQRPVHYDGSGQISNVANNEPTTKEPFTITDEMRKNISGNPYQA